VIAVDTSALVAIALNEPRAADCIAILTAEDLLLISAVSMSEALIVARQRDFADEMSKVLHQFGFRVIPVTEAMPQRIEEIYRRWGRGNHPARLNFGDCFSYHVAMENECSLLYVGEDFAKTDVRSALGA
jgi:ribonuclease VapC